MVERGNIHRSAVPEGIEGDYLWGSLKGGGAPYCCLTDLLTSMLFFCPGK
jgi:hypothetical protein